jgi:hypothetical protein
VFPSVWGYAGVVVGNLKDVGLGPGTVVMIFKIFSPKIFAKNGVFDTKTKLKVEKS